MKLFEEFKEDIYFYMTKLLKELLSNLKKWFNEGMLSSEEGLVPLYFEVMDKGLNPYTLVTFESNQKRYDIYFFASLEELLDLADMSNYAELEIKIDFKIFDENSDLLTTKTVKMLYQDLNEDNFLASLAELKDQLEENES